MRVSVAIFNNKGRATVFSGDGVIARDVEVADLPAAARDADIVWTPASEDDLWASKLGSFTHIKPADWLPTSLPMLLQELAETPNAAQTAARAVTRTVQLLKQALPTLALDTRQVVREIAEACPLNEGGFEHGRHAYNKSSVIGQDYDVELRPCRSAHARAVLSVPCYADDWQECEPSLEAALAQPTISDCILTTDATTSFLKSIYSYGAGALQKQTKIAGHELLMVMARYKTNIQRMWVAPNAVQHPCASYLPSAGMFTHASLSVGLAHEVLLNAAVTPINAKTPSAANAILAAADRAYLLPVVIHVAKLGLQVSGFGAGKIILKQTGGAAMESLRAFAKETGMTLATRRGGAKTSEYETSCSAGL